MKVNRTAKPSATKSPLKTRIIALDLSAHNQFLFYFLKWIYTLLSELLRKYKIEFNKMRIFNKLSNLPPFWSTILISLLSVLGLAGVVTSIQEHVTLVLLSSV